MHRFVWNLTWAGSADGDALDDEYGAPHGPRAAPGDYEVRLTVDGKTLTQPFKIEMDPRSTATAEELEQQLKVGQQIYAETLQSRRVLEEIRSVQSRLTELQSKLPAEQTDAKAAATSAAADIQTMLSGAPPGAMGLEKANAGLASALRVVESSDRAIPAQAMAVEQESSAAMRVEAGEWSQFKTARLPELNQQLQKANVGPIAISEIEKEVDELISN